MKTTRKSFKALAAFAAAMTLLTAASCTTGGQNKRLRYTSGPEIAKVQSERYNGPKARIAVVKFVNKAAKATGQIGSGMADMLSTSLFHSNRFIVLDRQDLDAVLNEQDFAESGRISESTAAAVGQLEGADLLVMGAVTEFEPEHIGAGGIVLGVVSFGASVAVAVANDDVPVGAVTYLQSHVAIDIKIVDAKTGRIVHANSVKGEYKNWGGGLVGGIGGGASRTGVGVGGFSGTGADQALRVCIDKAVEEIVRSTPAEYYRVDEGSAPVLANQLIAFYPIELQNATPEGPLDRHTEVISDEAAYQNYLAFMKLNASEAPMFDWNHTRLLAVHAGRKPTQGHKVAVFKAVEKNDAVEVEIVESAPAQNAEVKPLADFPYDLVRIKKSEKPVKFLWK